MVNIIVIWCTIMSCVVINITIYIFCLEKVGDIGSKNYRKLTLIMKYKLF